MSSNQRNAQFDSDGKATFGDAKTVTNGTFTNSTKDTTAEVLQIKVADGNGKSGISAGVTIVERNGHVSRSSAPERNDGGRPRAQPLYKGMTTVALVRSL
jgi:hypothetical protein